MSARPSPLTRTMKGGFHLRYVAMAIYAAYLKSQIYENKFKSSWFLILTVQITA